MCRIKLIRPFRRDKSCNPLSRIVLINDFRARKRADDEQFFAIRKYRLMFRSDRKLEIALNLEFHEFIVGQIIKSDVLHPFLVSVIREHQSVI